MTTPSLLEVQGLVKHFPLKKDVFGRGGGVVRAVDGAHHTATSAKDIFLERKMLYQALDFQQAWRCHCLTSMAERKPSLSKLKAIDVQKIITPGKAAIQGWV